MSRVGRVGGVGAIEPVCLAPAATYNTSNILPHTVSLIQHEAAPSQCHMIQRCFVLAVQSGYGLN